MALTATAPETPAEFLSCLAPATGLRQFSVGFPREPSSAGQARQIARDRLAVWELPRTGDLMDRVVLTISELMSNAIQHGAAGSDGTPEITLAIRFLPGVAIGVRVEDRSSVMPVLRERRSAEAVDGRGPRKGGMGVLPVRRHLPLLGGVRPVIIYLHGSRGTGKSALARGLAATLGAHLLSKEELHKALFPREGHPLSEEKDGWLCDLLLQATAWNLDVEPTRTIVLDAQRAGRAAEVAGLLRFSRALNQDLHVVECVHPGRESERRPESRRCRPVEGHHDSVPRDRTHLVDISAPASAALQIALSCLRASTRMEPSHGDGGWGSDGVPAAMSDAL